MYSYASTTCSFLGSSEAWHEYKLNTERILFLVWVDSEQLHNEWTMNSKQALNMLDLNADFRSGIE